ncbi:hypothetical protein [Paraburkholderia elongata]|uniref:hypothetical protein n=1 Tax=Paraburkholderia elongata TaxID=2675747 RepID=UPI001C12D9B1|nr:hypothetical protein [Paraburkholderia elongata]
MLLWAVVFGVTGAFATAPFREGIDLLQELFGAEPGNIIEMARHLSWPLRIALPAVGGVVAGTYLVIAQRRTITIGDGVVSVWQSMWRSISSLFTLASGGSISHEGSTVAAGLYAGGKNVAILVQNQGLYAATKDD